jgi:nucleoid-associated protein YgaU
MKEQLYLLRDEQIIEKARATSAEQQRGDVIAAIRKDAKAETRRVTTKAQRITEQVMAQVPEQQRGELSGNVSELVKKRERSRAGLASYLIGKEYIRQEHVREDGSLDIAALKQTAYFQKNQHFTEALATYELSKKSKLRQKKTEGMNRTVRPEGMSRRDEPTDSSQLMHLERAERIRQKLHPKKETLFRRLKKKMETKRKEGKEKPKRKRWLKAGIGAAGVAMAAGLAISCNSEASHEDHPQSKVETSVTPHPKPKETKGKPKETEKPKKQEKQNPVPKKNEPTYIVKKDDNLSDIAQRYYGKELWQDIYKANKAQIKDPDMIHPGQKLIIPKEKTPDHPQKPQPPKKVITYNVQKDDTLSELAQKFKTDIPSIMEKNKKIKDEDVIFTGDKLVIPLNKHRNDHSKMNSSHWDAFIKKQSVHGRDWVDFLNCAKKISQEEKYPLSVLVGQAVIETGHGKSKFAVQRNNFFGYNAYDSNPNAAVAYQSKEASIKQYIDLIRESPRYKQAYANKDNPKKMVELIKEGGYATDPHYVQKVTHTKEFKTLQKAEA